MSRRGSNDSVIGLIIWLVIGAASAAYFLLKWILAFVVFIVTAIFGKNKQPKQMPDIDAMSGAEFERFFADLLRKEDYKKVTVTPASGDYGVDVVAERCGTRYAFQCKCYQSSVGVSAVQEVYSGAKMYQADTPVVVTNSYFTPNAANMAKRLGVLLWDRDYLNRMLGNSFASQNSTQKAGQIPTPDKLELPAKQPSVERTEASVVTSCAEKEPAPKPTENEAPPKTGFEECYKVETVLSSGKYSFGKNIPHGTYDLFVKKGSGWLTIVLKPDGEEKVTRLGVEHATVHRGLDSTETRYFRIEGDVEVQISKAKMIEVKD